jgi:hypothetical protein
VIWTDTSVETSTGTLQARGNHWTILQTVVAQAIKIAATKLIIESGLQESNPSPLIDLLPTTPRRHCDQKEGESTQGSEMHPCCMSFITISHNPWWMSSCLHSSRNDGGATFGGETLDKTHNNQSLSPSGVAAIDYKGSRDVGTPLDAPLLGSDMKHAWKPKIWCHNT